MIFFSNSDDVDFGDEGDDAGGDDAGGDDLGFGESIRNKADNLITEQKDKYNKKINKYQNNYFGKLLNSVKKENDVVLNERVKITNKSVKINENIGNMIEDIDKMINE